MSKEAMKLALEALELINLEFVCANGSHHAKKDRHEWDEDCPITDRWRKAITALQKALANEALDKMAENARDLGLDYEPAQQEPFGYFKAEPFGWTDCAESDEGAVALYERPQRTWVGLTDEELKPLCAENHIVFGAYTVDFIRAIEAKLRSKNEDRN